MDWNFKTSGSNSVFPKTQCVLRWFVVGAITRYYESRRAHYLDGLPDRREKVEKRQKEKMLTSRPRRVRNTFLIGDFGNVKNYKNYPCRINSQCVSDVVRIGSLIIFHLSKLSKAKFFILCDAIFLVRLRGKCEIDHTLGVKELHFSVEYQSNYMMNKKSGLRENSN